MDTCECQWCYLSSASLEGETNTRSGEQNSQKSKVTSKMASSKRVLYIGKKSIKIVIKITNPSFLNCASLTLQPRACLGMRFRLSAVARKGAKDEISAYIARSRSFNMKYLKSWNMFCFSQGVSRKRWMRKCCTRHSFPSVISRIFRSR